MNHRKPASIAATFASVLALGLAACSEGEAPPAPPAGEEAAIVASAPATEVDPDLAVAESFIDAFYSFDRERLAPLLASAPETAPRILYYQGSAQGGNYEVLKRTPCARDEDGIVLCPVKVKDDRVQALGTGFDVTDTFHLTFEDGVIVKVTTSSNDQDIYRQAAVWVRENMPEVMEGPCRNRGTLEGTPVECSKAMTAGYKAFVASPDFPGVPPLPEGED
ncbi:MAG: hypothetical protein V2J02_14890 [Pseudomonadales bacterium]|jgi:hypothetical protein|nr:hypothetical protein [Pseudomonadales bacterium]